MSTAKDLHQQSAQAREAGKFAEALSLSDQALVEFGRDRDWAGLAEVMADRSISLRNLANLEDIPELLVLAKAEMTAAVEIIRSVGDESALVMPIYNLAKLEEELGETKEAINHYQEAIKGIQENPPASHDRPGVLADMQIHLGICEYTAGDKSALDRVMLAMEALKRSGEAKYNLDVWLSRGYMKLAEILLEDDSLKANQHLQEAKEIIENNPDLTVRVQQWEKLAKTFR